MSKLNTTRLKPPATPSNRYTGENLHRIKERQETEKKPVPLKTDSRSFQQNQLKLTKRKAEPFKTALLDKLLLLRPGIRPPVGTSRDNPISFSDLVQSKDPLAMFDRGSWIKTADGVIQINGGIKLNKDQKPPPMTKAQKLKSFLHLAKLASGEKLPENLTTRITRAREIVIRNAKISRPEI